MHIIFLRGSVPPKNEHPEKLLYDSIEECEDQWSQLFYYLTKKMESTAELLYFSSDKKRTFCVDESFIERWVPSFASFTPMRKPDLIVCRGGFEYYLDLVKRFPKAKKVYYGAGIRSYPLTSYKKYDLFLVDSKKQRKHIKSFGKRANLFIKPAATLFKPVDVPKEYDVCFMANASQSEIKRHKLLIQSFAGTNYKILNLGNMDKTFIRMAENMGVDITWGGWSLRKDLPEQISKCRVGVCCSSNYDSCPRVIPEYLACGLPVVATDNMNFWHDKYITDESGMLIDKHGILLAVQDALKKDYNTRKFYEENISMDIAVEYLKKLIEKIS